MVAASAIDSAWVIVGVLTLMPCCSYKEATTRGGCRWHQALPAAVAGTMFVVVRVQPLGVPTTLFLLLDDGVRNIM